MNNEQPAKTAKPRRIDVDTSEYVRSHFRAPRGHGGWLFLFDRQTDIMKCFSFNGTYAEARRMAVEHARQHGFRVARVQP